VAWCGGLDREIWQAYRDAMDGVHLRRQAIAIFVAYAVAMQMLLSAAVPVAASVLADPLGVLCSHNGGGAGDPAGNDQRCAAACATLGQGVAGPLPPDVVIAIAEPHAVLARTPRDDWVTPLLAVRAPWSPRGPPVA
jgi:hypothetical protein